MAISLITPASQGGVPAFSAYSNATQSVTTATATKVAINTEEYDTNSNYDPTTNYRFTPTVAGYYQVNGVLRVGGSTITAAYIALYKNGSVYQRGTEYNQTLGVTQLTGSWLIYLNGSTDYIELYGLVSGTAVTFNYATNFATSFFQASMVRAA